MDEAVLEVLGKTELFCRMNQTKLRRIMESPFAELEAFKPGDSLASREKNRRCLGILISGKARVYKSDLLMRTLDPGALFGCAGLFCEQDTYVSEITAAKPARVIFLPESFLEALMRENADMALAYIRFLSSRVCYLNGLIDEYTGSNAVQKLAAYLINCAGEKSSIQLEYSISDLAQALNLGRASLYRALEQLITAGYIERHGRDINILNLEGLKAQKGM